MAITRKGDEFDPNAPAQGGILGDQGGSSTPIGVLPPPVPPMLTDPNNPPGDGGPPNLTARNKGSGQGPTDLFNPTPPQTPVDTPRVTGPDNGPVPTAAPTQPSTPTPVASESPQPFTPMTPPSADLATPGIVRRTSVPGSPTSASSALLGQAGGLLGGGLAAPGTLGNGSGPDLADLILNLLKRANS